jgi:hypothetical protein
MQAINVATVAADAQPRPDMHDDLTWEEDDEADTHRSRCAAEKMDQCRDL